MSETIITVHGSARSELHPERAIVRFTMSADGPERASVVASVSDCSTAIEALLEARHDPHVGPVAAWSADRLTVTSHRPWTNDGSTAALVHRASVSGQATVSVVDEVSGLIGALVEHDLLAVDGLEWSLTDARLELETRDVRARAVSDALAKAEVLAASIGLESLTALALADPGMLDGGSGNPAPLPRLERAMAMDSRGDGGFSLRPEPIVVEAAVDARFSAR